jgi:hypothetical protein
VILTLTRNIPSLITNLALSHFLMHSPQAMNPN